VVRRVGLVKGSGQLPVLARLEVPALGHWLTLQLNLALGRSVLRRLLQQLLSGRHAVRRLEPCDLHVVTGMSIYKKTRESLLD
jgi:hypothetical protein